MSPGLTGGIKGLYFPLAAFNRRARNHLASSSALVIWLFAVSYSLTAAFGLAASTREWSANKQENAAQTKADIHAEIQDLKARKRTAKINARIDELNQKLETTGETKTPDPQAAFLSPHRPRYH